MRIRKKGVAIIEGYRGIMVVANKRRIYSLPGGGCDRRESRRHAMIREVLEETKLKVISSKFLFSYEGKIWRDYIGRRTKNHGKVFLAKTKGFARPGKEIRYVRYWKPGSKLRLSSGAKQAIEKYLEMKKAGKI